MATINRNGGDYHVAVNNAALGKFKSLEAAKAEAELVITNRIREMLPIYKTLVGRLENRFARNIIPMKPTDGA